MHLVINHVKSSNASCEKNFFFASTSLLFVSLLYFRVKRDFMKNIKCM